MTPEELLADMEKAVRDFAARIQTQSQLTTGIPGPPRIEVNETALDQPARMDFQLNQEPTAQAEEGPGGPPPEEPPPSCPASVTISGSFTGGPAELCEPVESVPLYGSAPSNTCTPDEGCGYFYLRGDCRLMSGGGFTCTNGAQTSGPTSISVPCATEVVTNYITFTVNLTWNGSGWDVQIQGQWEYDFMIGATGVEMGDSGSTEFSIGPTENFSGSGSFSGIAGTTFNYSVAISF